MDLDDDPREDLSDKEKELEAKLDAINAELAKPEVQKKMRAETNAKLIRQAREHQRCLAQSAAVAHRRVVC